MQNIINSLKGYKTYIVAVLTFAYGLYQTFSATGGTWRTFAPWLLSSAGLAALRAAIAKL